MSVRKLRSNKKCQAVGTSLNKHSNFDQFPSEVKEFLSKSQGHFSCQEVFRQKFKKSTSHKDALKNMKCINKNEQNLNEERICESYEQYKFQESIKLHQFDISDHQLNFSPIDLNDEPENIFRQN